MVRDVQLFLDRVHRGDHGLAVRPSLRRDCIDDAQEDVFRDRRRYLENCRGRDVIARHLDRGHIERRADRPALRLEELRLQPELQKALRVPGREPVHVHRSGEHEFPLAQFVAAFAFEQQGDRIAKLVRDNPAWREPPNRLGLDKRAAPEANLYPSGTRWSSRSSVRSR